MEPENLEGWYEVIMNRIYYESGDKKKLYLDRYPFWLQTGDFLNYGWIRNERNERINGFKKGITEKEFLITVFGNTDIEYAENWNHIHDVFEKDICEKTQGKLYFGDWYLSCYIFASEKSGWEYGCNMHDSRYRLVTDYPLWVRQNTYNFNIYKATSTDNKRHAYKYAYRYANGLSNTYIINPHFTDSNFKLIIYGPAVNPMVIIGENTYLVYIILEENERLEIDSRAGIVHKILRNGTIVNAFHNRQKQRTFFQKIKPGRQPVSWTGKFPFDLIIYEERSEPKWN